MHFKLILVTLLVTSSCNGANILGIFFYPSYSHQQVYHSLVKDLSERGHNLTILTADRMENKHPNITEIFLESSYEENINFVQSRDFGGLKLFFEMIYAHVKRTNRQFKQPEVRELIDNHANYKFDILLLEFMHGSEFLYFGELYDCPIIGISSMDIGIPVHEMLGNYANPVVHPERVITHLHGRLTFMERLSSFVYFIGTKFFLQPIFETVGFWKVIFRFHNLNFMPCELLK